jgi:hypothetical protein
MVIGASGQNQISMNQQTQAAKQATDTNVSNSATDLAEALGKNRETLQFDPQREI